MELKKQLGKRIKELREMRNFSQEFIAEKLDINAANYWRIENGMSYPKPENLEKICEILNVKDLQKVLYVGDNKIDFITASNAGVDSMIVTWGPRVLPNDVHPNYKIAGYEELRRLLTHE